jgi:hypothetical protein
MESRPNPLIKYIESNELEETNLFIQSKGIGMTTLNGRIELFDFTDETAALSKDAVSTEADLNSIAPVQRKRSNSCSSYSIRRPRRRRSSSLGDLDEPSSHKILLNLVASMTEIFPDYSFDSVKPNQFLYKEIPTVIHSVNTRLAELCIENPQFLNTLWQRIDFAIDIQVCEIFEYHPSLTDGDPFTDGSLWSFNYFFLNKETSRLLYFTCSSIRYMYLLYCSPLRLIIIKNYV